MKTLTKCPKCFHARWSEEKRCLNCYPKITLKDIKNVKFLTRYAYKKKKPKIKPSQLNWLKLQEEKVKAGGEIDNLELYTKLRFKLI